MNPYRGNAKWEGSCMACGSKGEDNTVLVFQLGTFKNRLCDRCALALAELLNVRATKRRSKP